MIKDFKSVAEIPFFKQLSEFGGKFSPNHITLIGFAGTLAATAFALSGNFAFAAFAVLVHLICDGLDGYVARKFEKASQIGFLLDHILDRVSDLVLFPVIGLVTNAFIPGLFVAIVCLFSSYIGVLNKTIGAPQDKGGTFAKTYRYQLLIILLVVFHFLPDMKTQLFSYFCYGSLFFGITTVFGRTRSLFFAVLGRGDVP